MFCYSQLMDQFLILPDPCYRIEINHDKQSSWIILSNLPRSLPRWNCGLKQIPEHTVALSNRFMEPRTRATRNGHHLELLYIRVKKIWSSHAPRPIKFQKTWLTTFLTQMEYGDKRVAVTEYICVASRLNIYEKCLKDASPEHEWRSRVAHLRQNWH